MMNGISIGLESNAHRIGANFDAVAAYAEVVSATEELDNYDRTMAMLTLSANTIEDSCNIANSVSATTGNEASATAVALHGLKVGLEVIGNGSHFNAITAGTESLSAGNEAAMDIIKKVYEKMKEMAKKAWDYIIKLIDKVKAFFLGAIDSVSGGGSKAGKSLLLKLQELKAEDGRMNATGATIKDDDKKAIVEKIAGLAIRLSGNINANEITAHLKSLNKKLTKSLSGKKLLKNIGETSKILNNVDKISANALGKDVVSVITDGGNQLNEGIGYDSEVLTVFKKDGTVNDLLDLDKKGSDSIFVTLVGVTLTEATFKVCTISSDGIDALNDLNDIDETTADKGYNKLLAKVAMAKTGVKNEIKTITTSKAKDEVVELADKVEMSTYDDTIKMVNGMITFEKTVADAIVSLSKDAKTAEENAKTISENIESVVKKGSGSSDITERTNAIVNATTLINEQYIDNANGYAKAVANAGKDTINTGINVYVEKLMGAWKK